MAQATLPRGHLIARPHRAGARIRCLCFFALLLHACKLREVHGVLEGRAGSHGATSSSKGILSFLSAAQPSIGRKIHAVNPVQVLHW